MDLEELTEALDGLFPDGFTLDYDSHGQLIINTGLKHDDNSDDLVPLSVEDQDEDYDEDEPPEE